MHIVDQVDQVDSVDPWRADFTAPSLMPKAVFGCGLGRAGSIGLTGAGEIDDLVRRSQQFSAGLVAKVPWPERNRIHVCYNVVDRWENRKTGGKPGKPVFKRLRHSGKLVACPRLMPPVNAPVNAGSQMLGPDAKSLICRSRLDIHQER